jgi:hypothetical protein
MTCIYLLETKVGGLANRLFPARQGYQITDEEVLARFGRDAMSRAKQHDYTKVDKISQSLTPLEFYTAARADESSIWALYFKVARGEPFPDIYTFGGVSLVSTKAKKVIETVDDPACHHFLQSGLFDKAGNVVSDEPYYSWRVLRCIGLTRVPPVNKRSPFIGGGDQDIASLLTHPTAFEAAAKIPVWRPKFSTAHLYFSEPFLQGLRSADLTGLDPLSQYHGSGRAGAAVERIDLTNLVVNYEQTERYKRTRAKMEKLKLEGKLEPRGYGPQ